ncbi:MAG: hypothetical protein AB9834_09830 [Lentimicrobium sp.]
MAHIMTNSEFFHLPSGTGRFTCKYCGGKFDLSPDEQITFSLGFFTQYPDTCLECLDMINNSDSIAADYASDFSDADCGL